MIRTMLFWAGFIGFLGALGGGIALIAANTPDRGRCLASHRQTAMTFVFTGKVAIPMPVSSTICDRWEFPQGRSRRSAA